MIDFAAWAWPQWVLLAYVGSGLLLAPFVHGTDTQANGFVFIARWTAILVLLVFGGFFG